jgi:hypothetical protein
VLRKETAVLKKECAVHRKGNAVTRRGEDVSRMKRAELEKLLSHTGNYEAV